MSYNTDIYKNSEQHLHAHYERVYDAEHDFRNFNLVRVILSHARGKRLLDIGCGSGFLLDQAHKKGMDAIGIEPNAGTIELARRRNPQLSLFQGGAEDIDTLMKEPLHTITATDVLEHLEDDSAIVQKIFSHLHPGGRVVIAVPAYPFLYGIRDKNYGHYRRYTGQQLKDVLGRNGFNIIHVRYWNMLGVLPYLIAEKILGRPLETRLREKQQSGRIKSLMHSLLHAWFAHVENKINLGFGLSLIAVAEKPKLV